VVQHISCGSDIPPFPTAHASQVASNLHFFCRTILAAVDNDSKQPQQGNSFSLSTFCLNVIELDKHRDATEPSVKKQRV